MSTNSQNRVAWISILQAITMAAVLIGHIDLAGDLNPDYPIASWLDRLQAFQMPVFFFISGFLFVRSSLFHKSYSEIVKNKLHRLGIPFLFMSLFMWIVKLCLPQSMLEHPVSLSWNYLFNVFFVPWNGPIRHLWFLETLFLFFLLMPLYKWTLKNKWTSALWIIFLIGLTYHPYRFLDIDINSDTAKILCLERDCTFWLFFYIGMVVYKFDLIKYLQNKWIFVVSCIIYYVLCFFPIGLRNSVGIIGIVYITSLSYLLANKLPNLFSSYSKYTYQIYLLHMLPIMAVKFIYRCNLLTDDIWFPVCWIISLLSAIYIPTVAAKIAEKCPKNIRMLIGL